MARTIAWMVAVVLAAWAPSCGGSDGVETSPLDPGTDDFTYDPGSFDRGSLEGRMELLEQFRAVQRDFYAGDAEAVCAGFNRRTIFGRRDYTFDPDQCVKDVDRVAGQVLTRATRWPLHTVDWVRIYRPRSGFEAVGGVTVSGEGRRIRMGFVKRGGEWFADFDVPDELQGLSTRLRASRPAG